MIFRCGTKCFTTDFGCDCPILDGKELDDQTMCVPPLHDGCDCYLDKVPDEHPNPITNRPGRFKVSQAFIDFNAVDLLRVMARCVPYRVEYHHFEGAFEYWAYSWEFDEVKEGSQIPEYMWWFNRETNTVAARRVDQMEPLPPEWKKALDKAFEDLDKRKKTGTVKS